MSIATELTKLRNNKAAIKAAITTKTGTDAGDDMSTYATKISGISGEGSIDFDVESIKSWMPNIHNRTGLSYQKIISAYAKYGKVFENAVQGFTCHQYDGNGFFVVDYKPSNNTTLKMSAMVTANSKNHVMIGCGAYNTAPYFIMYGYENGKYLTFRMGKNTPTTHNAVINEKYSIEYGLTTGAYINGSQIAAPTSYTFSTTYNMTIGAGTLDGASNADYSFYGRIWKVEVWEGNTLVRMFLPIADNKLYDVVNDVEYNCTGSCTLMTTIETVYDDDTNSMVQIFKVRNGETDTYAPTVVPNNTHYLFHNISSLDYVDFSNVSSVKISEYMFDYCNLKDINFGDCEITEIGDYAFSENRYGSSTHKIKFDNFTGTYIGTKAFVTCGLLESIVDLSVCPNLTSLGNGVFVNTWVSSFKLSNTLTSIGSSCFSGLFNCFSITIPDSITNIPNQCFDNSKKLVIINFGNTRTTIPSLSSTNAFDRGDNDNRKIIVPDALYDDWIQATNWNSTTNNIVGSIIKYGDAVSQGIITE